MKNANAESRLWEILGKERLADLSQFHTEGFYDELPLFSREADVAFLSASSDEEPKAILLRFALKFLKSVISYEEHRTAYFAAITVYDFGAGGPFVPNLFVWSGPIRKLDQKLALQETITPSGRETKALLSKLGVRKKFAILEDRSGIPEFSRVFITQVDIPYSGFVPLTRFRKPEPMDRVK